MMKILLDTSKFLLDNYIIINFVVSLVLAGLILLTIFQKKQIKYSNKEFRTINITREVLLSIIPRFIYSIILVSLIAFAIGYRPYIVTSGSMRPSIEPGAVVLIKKVPFNKLEVGDVITFSYSGTENVTHQIIAIKKDGVFELGEEYTYTINNVNYKVTINESNVGKTIITHGTANSPESIDGAINYSNVKGRVSYCVWYVGLIVFIIRKQLFAFILLLFTLFFAYISYFKYPKYIIE